VLFPSRPNPEKPIALSLRIAGSVIPDFRAPIGSRNSSGFLPVGFWLEKHGSGHRQRSCRINPEQLPCAEADQRGAYGADDWYSSFAPPSGTFSLKAASIHMRPALAPTPPLRDRSGTGVDMFKNIVISAIMAVALVSPATAQDDLTDPQIAHVAYTAGEIDIAAAEQALRKSKNPVVTEFAETMVRDHRAVNEQALALVEELGVTPEDNATSTALTEAAEAKLEELEALEGEAFDAAYVANEVAFHQTVNEALETTLITSADNDELKTLLESGLTLFSEHQMHAEHLAATFK
jgi:putative membrane protein